MQLRESGMPDVNTWESFFDPAAVLRALGIERVHGPVVDLCAGYGTFTIAAARMTDQPVYSIDVDAQMVAHVDARRAELQLHNIRPVQQDLAEQGARLSDGSASYIMLFNVLHCEDPDLLLAEAHRLLMPNGLLAVTHWVSDRPTPRGPSLEIRPRPEQCAEWARRVGFVLDDGPIDLPPHHFGLVFARP